MRAAANFTRPSLEGYIRPRSEVGSLSDAASQAAVRRAFVTVLLLAWVTAVVIMRWKRQKLRLPPGPPALPIVGNLPFVDKNLHQYLAQVAHKYGPIFRLRLGQKLTIVVSSPSLARELFKDHDSVFANHDVPLAALVLPNGPHGLAWAPHGQQWRVLRKLAVGELLNNGRLEAYHNIRREEVRRLVQHIYNRSGSPIIIREQLFNTLFDILMGMLWGRTLKEGKMKALGEEFRQVIGQLLGSFGKLTLSDLFPILAPLDRLGLVRWRKQKAARLHQILDAIIDLKAQTADEENSKEFIQVLLRRQKSGDAGMPLTRDKIKGLITDLVMAGMDTTAVTTEWAMAELIEHPEVMSRVQEEVDQVVGKERMVEEADTSHLKYLNAVIKEAMRLHPVAPLMLPRTPSETCTLGGYSVPKGSRVLVNMWAIERDPGSWERPAEFDPERFLTANRKWDFSGNDTRFFPFGSGRRICPGAPFANRMLMYGLATLLHSFDWRLPEGVQNDLTEKFGTVMKKEQPLALVPTARLSDSVLLASSS